MLDVEIPLMLAEVLAVNAEIEGMKAENKQCEIQGESMAFVSEAFDNKACELRTLYRKYL